MIDLHSHLLPGIDDGATDLDVSLQMARMAVADGITVMACTPHIMPTVYENEGPQIREMVGLLQQGLENAGIPLKLVTGADVHMDVNLVAGLRSGRLLTLNDSRYLLLEPPHHVLPRAIENYVFGLHAAGYVVILTHPERMTWLEANYALVERLVHSGVLLQITAGALVGKFGRGPRYWAEKMLDEGMCHLLATDSHNTQNRSPNLAEARDVAALRLGEQEATDMVFTRPLGILDNLSPGQLPVPQRREKSEERWSWQSLVGLFVQRPQR